MLFDFGGNLLPGFVGGSKRIEDCAERIRNLYSSGINAALLIPRYYPAKMTVEEFIRFRYKIICDLYGNMPQSDLHMYLGCEVYIDERLKYISSIGELAVRGTRVIIADMPAGVWERELIETLYGIRGADYEVLIAHIDRYPKQYALDLFEQGFKALADIDAFIGVQNLKYRKQLLTWIDEGHIVGLASNFEADEKHVHKKIQKICEIIGADRMGMLEVAGARLLAGARPYPNFIY